MRAAAIALLLLAACGSTATLPPHPSFTAFGKVARSENEGARTLLLPSGGGRRYVTLTGEKAKDLQPGTWVWVEGEAAEDVVDVSDVVPLSPTKPRGSVVQARLETAGAGCDVRPGNFEGIPSTVYFTATLEIRNLTDRTIDVIFEPFLVWWPDKQTGLVLRDGPALEARKEPVCWTLQPREIRKGEVQRKASPAGPRAEGPCLFLIRVHGGGESATLAVEGWFAVSF